MSECTFGATYLSDVVLRDPGNVVLGHTGNDSGTGYGRWDLTDWVGLQQESMYAIIYILCCGCNVLTLPFARLMHPKT